MLKPILVIFCCNLSNDFESISLNLLCVTLCSDVLFTSEMLTK